MRRRALLENAAAVGMAATVPALRAAEPHPLPKIGDALALPDVELFDGKTFRAAQARGQVVLVYWWASWCPYCAEQTPHIQKLWDAQRAKGLQMLGLSIDRRVDDAKRYMAQRGYSFPSGHNSAAIEKVMPKPTKALPVTLVRGRDGRVVTAEAGQLFPEDVEGIGRFL